MGPLMSVMGVVITASDTNAGVFVLLQCALVCTTKNAARPTFLAIEVRNSTFVLNGPHNEAMETSVLLVCNHLEVLVASLEVLYNFQVDHRCCKGIGGFSSTLL